MPVPLSYCSVKRAVRGEPNVFGARALGTLARPERHGLSFAQLVEATVGARRLVEEVLVAIRGGDESKALIADQTLDGSVHR